MQTCSSSTSASAAFKSLQCGEASTCDKSVPVAKAPAVAKAMADDMADATAMHLRDSVVTVLCMCHIPVLYWAALFTAGGTDVDELAICIKFEG